MKKCIWKGQASLVIALLCILFTSAIAVKAEEAAGQKGIGDSGVKVMAAIERTEARKEADINSPIIAEYETGDLILITGELGEEWYKVSYQDKEGYIRKDTVTEHIKEEALAPEINVMKEEGKLVVEEVERYRAQARRSRIWGVIIVALVGAIFATGIIATVRNKKRGMEEKEEKSNE